MSLFNSFHGDHEIDRERALLVAGAMRRIWGLRVRGQGLGIRGDHSALLNDTLLLE